MNINLSAITLLIMILFAVTSAAANYIRIPNIDSTAHDFTLKTIQGTEIKLSDLTAEKYVVLLVLRGWPGYQCPICTRQVGEFLSYADDFNKRGATVLMVYPGPSKYLEDHASEFVEDKVFPGNFIFTLDPDYTMTNLYGLRWDEKGETAYPSTFVIDMDGIIRYSKISDSHGGRTSAKEVLTALDEIKTIREN